MPEQTLADSLAAHEDVIETLRRAKGASTHGPMKDRIDFNPEAEFTNWFDEQRSWKETCYIGYWSFMPNLYVEGPDALRLFSDLTVNTFDNFRIGQAKHAVLCNEDGKVINDGVLLRLGEDKLDIQGVYAWPKFNAETGPYDVTATARDKFIYQVQGPNALQVMQEVTDYDLRTIDFMNFEVIGICGHDVITLRQGMSGEVGFELQGPQEHGEEIWEAVLEAGQEHDIKQLGQKTQLINHLEMSFPTTGFHYLPAIYSEDMSEYREWLTVDQYEASYSIEGSFDADSIDAWHRSPVELGWRRNINFDHDFVGREALEAEVESPRRTNVTLVWDDDDLVDVYGSLYQESPTHKYMEMPLKQRRTVQADEVRKEGSIVGVSTGRGYSYFFRDMLSLCSIDVAYSEPGTEVEIVWGEGRDPSSPTVESHEPKTIGATVAQAPYKEDNRRSSLRSVAGTRDV